MTDRFFITGLPRSGTAWVANYLTYGNSFCYHEGLMLNDKIHDYSAMLDATNADVVGDSDTIIAAVLPWLYEKYPDAKYVFIKRDVEDVEQSLINNGFSTHKIPEITRSLKWGMSHIKSMTISFDDLFENMERVCEYIGVDCFTPERDELLRHMRIDECKRYTDMKPYNVGTLINSFMMELH